MKICLLEPKLLAKIKLKMVHAEVSFVYSSHSQEYTRYWSTADSKWNSLHARKEIEKNHEQWI
jgi:hypothetical protein